MNLKKDRKIFINKRKINKILFVLSIFIFSIFFSSNVLADDIKATNITLKDKSSTITVDSPVLSNDEVTSNITFNEVNDYATFELTITNNESEKYKIESITDNNTNNNIEVSYDYSKEFFTGETKVNIKLLYKNKLVNQEKVNINDLVINIKLVNEEGKTTEVVVNNPKTGDGILKYIILLITFVFGLVFINKKVRIKGIKLGSFIILLSILSLPFAIFAVEKYEVKIKFTDLVVKGEFETYNVSVEGVGNREVSYGDKIGNLPDQSKPGYTFNGYVDQNGNTVTEDTTVTGPMTVKPKFTPNTDTPYSVVHKTMDIGGTTYTEKEIENKTGTTDTPVTPDVKSYEGFTAPTKQTVTISGDGSTVVEYKYTRNKANLTINDSDYVEEDKSGEYYYGEKVSLTAKDKEGYTFAGWSNGETTKDIEITIGTNNITINPLYIASGDTTYTVIHKYTKLDGTYEEDSVVSTGTTGETVEAALQPRTGYVNPTKKNITIKADGTASVEYIYERETYTFSVSDRTYLDSTSTANGTYPYETQITVKATNREGYTFKWSDDDTALEKTFDLTENKTLSLEYTANTYNIVFDANGGTGTMSDQEMTYDQSTNLTKNTFEKTGYTFVGWNTETNGTGTSYDDEESVTNLVTSGEITLHAQYIANTNTPYTIIHKYQKIDTTYEEETVNKTGTTDTEVTAELKEREGFTSPTAQTLVIRGDGSSVVTYQYTRNKQQLTINNPEYVEEDKSGNYYYEEEITITAIDREGYTFAGWSNGETTKDITVTIGTSDITISPTYTANKYNVIFNANGGTGTMSNQELTYDLEANLTKNTFTKTNYIFDGWNTKEDGTGTSYEDEKTVKNLATSGNITLYAQWTFDSSSMYIISFDTDSETLMSDKEIAPGDSLGTLEEPTKDGAVFLGWYTDPTDGELVDENYTPESSMTLYARYKALLCKKATTLHTATCPSGKSCVNAGYSAGGSHGTNIVEFGSISYSNLVAGNAFDCDVNGDGTYDATNERFYYLRTLDDKAVLISHSNYEGISGQAITNNYDYGTALTMLPTTSSTQWKNVEVTFNNEYDTTDTTTYAARFVTYDDLREVTGKQTLSATGSLDDYAYLLENTQFVGVGRTGTWLMSETVNDVTTYYRMHTGTSNRHVKSEDTTSKNVARPVIEVPMKYIDTSSIDITTYEITFETNGGTAIDPINIEENASIGTFPTTTRNGYEFVGWYYDPELTNEVSNLDTFTEDTTLYAKWNAVAVAEINGTYYNTLASAISAVPATGVKTTVKLIKNATENITIPNTKNVELDLNGFTVNSASTNVINNNGTLEIKNGTISCSAGSGAINNNSGATFYMSSGKIEATGTRQGLYNDGGTAFISGTAIIESATNQRAAIQNRNNGTVTITGGTIVSKSLYALYNESGTITIGTKDNAFDNTTPVIQGKTFAIAANNTYNFYDGILKGGTSAIGTTSNTGNTPTVTADTNETKIANLEDNSTKVYGTEDIEGTTYNTLYCTVDNAKIKVTFEPNGGEVDPEFKMINSGDPIGELPTPTKGVYTFDGWFTGLTDGTIVDENTIPTGAVTYYAHWSYTASNEVVSFNINSDALDTYFTNISTWKDLDQTTFQSNMNSNFTTNSCSACNGPNTCTSPAAGTYCEQPKGYETGVEDSILVYNSDENTKEKGSLVTYTTSTAGTIYNMIPGKTYYWESSADSNIHGLVKASGNRRTIKSNVRNVRDLGGLEVSYTEDSITKSGTIKYGKLFRGAQLSSSSNDVTELAKLGVDYEIDLRPASDGNGQAAFTNHDSDIIITNYLIYPDTYESNYNALKNALKDTMNYLIEHKDDDKALYFHCTIGTDRTGTLAYFLEGLLGASEEDRVEDYELSYYYGMTNRDRYHDNLSGSSINPRFTTMHNTYDTNEKIYNWFFAKDTSQEEIDYDKALIQSFRDAMIDYN